MLGFPLKPPKRYSGKPLLPVRALSSCKGSFWERHAFRKCLGRRRSVNHAAVVQPAADCNCTIRAGIIWLLSQRSRSKHVVILLVMHGSRCDGHLICCDRAKRKDVSNEQKLQKASRHQPKLVGGHDGSYPGFSPGVGAFWVGAALVAQQIVQFPQKKSKQVA